MMRILRHTRFKVMMFLVIFCGCNGPSGGATSSEPQSESESTAEPESEGERSTAEPDAEGTGEPEAEGTGEPEVEGTGEPEAEGTGEPEAEVTGEPEVEGTGEPGAEGTGEPKAEGTGEPEVEGTGEPEAEGTGEPEVEGTGEPEAEGTGEPEAEGTEEPEVEGTGEPEAEGTGEPKAEGTGEPEVEGTGEPEAGGTGEPKAEGTGEPEVEGTGEPEAEGTGEPEAEGTGEPEVEGTGEPEAGGTGEPEVEGTGEPEAEGAGEPEVEGTGEPEAEGTGEPETTGTGEPETTGTGEPETTGTGEPNSESSGEADPEAEVTTVGEVCLFVTLYSLCIVFIVVGNAVVSALIIKDPKLRSNTSNLFLVSLVAARATIGIFVVPARITGMFSEEYLGSVLCKLCHFAATGSGAASVFSIIAIALVKHHNVMKGNVISDLSMRKSGAIIGFIWFMGFMYAVRAPIVNDLTVITIPHSGLSLWSCTIDPAYKWINKYFIFVDLVFLFAVPFIIVVNCYARVIKKLSGKLAEEKGNPSGKMDRQALRAIQMLMILMILFTVCTLAPMALKLYIVWGGGYFTDINTVEASIYLFSYSNSWFNLIVFAVFRDDLRAAFMRMWRKNCSRRNKVASGSMIKVKHQGGNVVTTDSAQDRTNREAMMIMEF